MTRPQRQSDYRPLVGGQKWNELVADLLRTEHEEKDNLMAQQEAILELFKLASNKTTQQFLFELSTAQTRLIASKLRRIESLYTLLAMRERPADDDKGAT